MYTDQDIANLVSRLQQLEMQAAANRQSAVPQNLKMLSPNFLTRAFAIWGHNFVASLLIGIAVSCLFTIIGLILGVSAFSWITQMIQNMAGS